MKLAGIILLSISGGIIILLGVALIINMIWDYELFETANVNGKMNGSIIGTILFVSMLILCVGVFLLIIGVGEVE